MMVRDIYGNHSPFHDLQGDLLASSFAKVANDQGSDPQQRFRKEDVLASLVCMISFNIGQLAYYQAAVHNCDTIYFVGNFVRNNLLGMSHIRMIVDLM
jgi:type II pantothenate kinase